MSAPMTDRERLEGISRIIEDVDYCHLGKWGVEPVDILGDVEWLVKMLKKDMDEQETVRKQYKLFCRTIREYDKLMLERRKELDVYNREHPKE